MRARLGEDPGRREASAGSGAPSILLVEHRKEWGALFEDERAQLEPVLTPFLRGPVVHVGSTAVPDLLAKPVIDIMAGVEDLPSSREAIESLQPLEYCYYPYRAESMHWFCKPSPMARTHHLHLVPFGSALWDARLLFRDTLRACESVRRGYGRLKQRLAERFPEDREAYTEAKTSFIQEVLRHARRKGADQPEVT